MEHPFHDDLHGAVPMFGRNGTALNADERARIAQKRGLCVRCGTKTHGGNILRKVPLNNNDVYQGTCIKCNPQAVPPAVLAEWESRNRPAACAPAPGANLRFRGATRAVQYANRSGSLNQPGPPGHGTPGHRPMHARPPNAGPGPASSMITADVTVSTSPVPPGRGRNSAPINRSLSSPQTVKPKQQGVHRSTSDMPKAPIARQAAAPPSLAAMSSATATIPRSTQHGIDAEDFQSSLDDDSFTLVKRLKDYRDNPDALRQVMHGIRNLVDDQAAALSNIKDIMELYRNDVGLMALSIGAVWGIVSSDHGKKEEAVDTGVVEIIVDAIRNGVTKDDPDTVQWALGSLALLAQNHESQQFIAEKGGIEAIVEALKAHGSNPGVFEWACRSLYAMVVDFEGIQTDAVENDNERNVVTLLEAKGIAIIVGAMRNHVSEAFAQVWAMRLLWRLLDRPDDSEIERTANKLTDENCISVCVKLVKARSTCKELFAMSCELISMLLPATEENSSSYDSAMESVSTCVRMMNEHSGDVVVESCCIRLLGVIADGCVESRRVIDETNGIRTAVDAMSRFTDNEDLLESGVKLLWILSTNFDPSLLRDIGNLFETVIKSYPNNLTLGLSVCGFVANACISIHGINSADLPIESIMSISTNTNDSEVREEASRALSTICSFFPEVTDRLDDEISERFIEGLCSSREGIQSSCCSALTSIAKHSEEKRSKIFSSGCIDTAAAGLLVTSSEYMAVNLLELISALVTSKVKKVMQLPNQAIQAVLTAMKVFPGITMVACATIRNLMLVQVPGFSSMNVDGLTESMTQIIDSQSSSQELIIEACGTVWAFAAKQSNHTSNSLAELFRSLLGLMTEHKGDGTPFNSAIETTASGALASVMHRVRDTPIHIQDTEVDMIISILDLSIEYDVENLVLMERTMDIILSLSYMVKEVLIQYGVIVVVIDCMVEHEHHEILQQKGCAILALLASTENLQVNLSIAETDGIDMIVSALAVFSENVEIQVDACRALSHLSIDHESRMLISSQGGLILLVNAMNSFMDDIDLLGAACSALLNLSADAEEQVLAGSNAVETVVKVMRHQPNSPTLQEKGLGVLQNVSMRSKDSKKSIAEVGGIDAVTFAIKEFMGSPAVLERAFTTMWSLAVYEENQVQIADLGGISLVINGMMANITYEKVQKQACGCLCTLSSNSRNKTLIREVGGVDAIVYSMWAHYNSDSLQIEACRALSSLAVNVQTNEVMIAGEAEISAIMTAMRRFPNSERLQEHACVALRNFLLSADNAELVRNNVDEVRKLMDHATHRFPDRCSERAKQVLASLR